MDLRAFAERMQQVQRTLPEAKAHALRRAAELVRDEAKALIGTEDESWPALADSTVEEKQRLGFTGKMTATDPLLRTGELRASIKVGDVTPEHAFVGTDDSIAPFQEHGTNRIPPRHFIGLATFRHEHEAQKLMGEVVEAHLKGRPDPARIMREAAE
jgi:HK97 gp10 family phage protein